MSTRSVVPWASSVTSTAIRCNARDIARASKMIVRSDLGGISRLKATSRYGEVKGAESPGWHASLDAPRRVTSLRADALLPFRPGGPMRRYLWSLVGLTLAVSSLEAQGLRDKISQLFIFADGQNPLFLGGTAGSDAATALHADHFVPSAVSDNGTLISFIGTAISQNVANIPVSGTSGGSTFRFEGGAPVRTSVSPGPVFAERAQTLGRGRVFVGATLNRLHFETLRGIPLNDIRLNFVHQNVDSPQCDSI